MSVNFHDSLYFCLFFFPHSFYSFSQVCVHVSASNLTVRFVFQIYNHSQYTKRSIHRAILNSARSLVFYANNPRMVPADVTPACHRMHITVRPQQPVNKQKVAQRRGKSQGALPKTFSKAKAGTVNIRLCYLKAEVTVG